MTTPVLSALVRVRDEEKRIGRLLDGLRRQKLDGPLEVVVVDSGSNDGTREEVRARGLEPIEIAAEEFTYGRALNIAADAAAAPLCAAVSAHVELPDEGWAARLLSALADERIACAFGERVGPDLRPLSGPVDQDLALARRHPLYGYSNSAGGFRRELWAQRPFDEDLPASEDKEWAWHWLQRGRLVRLDPALAVGHSHDDEGPVRIYRRVRGDVAACRTFSPVAPVGGRQALREWAAGPHRHRSRLRALLDPRRVAMIAGKFAGSRS